LPRPRWKDSRHRYSTITTRILPLCKGSASHNLNIGNLRRFTLCLPPLGKQRRIVTYLDEVHAKRDAIKHLQAETAAGLDALLPAILDKAFKGEL
jgi:type I restriction enzyme, S subunit